MLDRSSSSIVMQRKNRNDSTIMRAREDFNVALLGVDIADIILVIDTALQLRAIGCEGVSATAFELV